MEGVRRGHALGAMHTSTSVTRTEASVLSGSLAFHYNFSGRAVPKGEPPLGILPFRESKLGLFFLKKTFVSKNLSEPKKCFVNKNLKKLS